MADDMDEAADERAIELSSLAAIYPELVIDPSDPFTAFIDIPIEPIKPLTILFPSAGRWGAQTGLLTPAASEEALNSGSGYFTASHQTATPDQTIRVADAPAEEPVQDIHILSHLPPLKLHITLPDGYPSQEPPLFYVHTEASWIPAWRLQQLRDAGHTIWEEMGRDQVVFTYIDYLRGAADNAFSLTREGPDYLEVSQDLKLPLLDYDLKAKRAKFEQQTFECGICLEPKKGVKCHRLRLCGHVFCVACLQDFFNSCVTEGDVSNVKCIVPKCGEDSPRKTRRKEDRTLDPNELLQIPLSQEQVQRYIALKRKKKYESDPSTVYCPRTWCQGPARTKASEAAEALNDEDEEDQDPEAGPATPKRREFTYLPPADRLAICQDCNFAFCQVCKASWHGEFVICRTRNLAELSAEERASEEYVKLHSTPCPTCNARCQKSMGCNHMICPTCKSHFCYLCSSWLDEENPYQHFNDSKKPCFQRLWELEGGDGGM